jgi:cardiolipin synthase A/B
MSESLIIAVAASLHVLLQIGLSVRVVLSPHRDPASRIAWLVVIFSMPVAGLILYALFGEVNIGKLRAERRRRLREHMPELPGVRSDNWHQAPAALPEAYVHLFRIGQSISLFQPVGGNRGTLLHDADATIDAMVADIDAAKQHVHLLFYIWLPDNNGRKIAQALQRAAQRGVTCRAMADDLGSRPMIDSPHWLAMHAAGVHTARALPIGNPLLRLLKGRIDVRNHRKIVVIDDRITYCGSQNCADPAFLIKAKYAPWVDAMVRFEGPVARQNQYLFVGDWMAHVDEDLIPMLTAPVSDCGTGFIAQVTGTGPTVRYSAMPEMFESLIYSARRELIVTTPYYVPNRSMQAALCTCARRGVVTRLVLPARNDSWVVAAASHSYYRELLAAGVTIHEFNGGLLHAKTLTVDGETTLIGSANMDRRSFDLNYENNILFYDPVLTLQIRERQLSYIADATPVSVQAVDAWHWRRRLWNNSVAMLGPIL